ncbi:MAG: hypothetical protein ACRERD_17700 [Candidatus Binatia bacterium]
MKSALKRKNIYLDEAKVRRAQRILETQTDAETIDRALDLVVLRKKILQSLEQTAGKGWGGTTTRKIKRPVGLAKGQFKVPPEFFAPLPSDVLAAFSGEEP